MNKYLLLRDNKQTGPYTVDELRTKGLKPYDLVWLEGKSAAWRYPSEIADLTAFAPAVEEQPYDRFYKKKPAQQQANTTVQPEMIVVTAPVEKAVLTQHITTKKIYVTLPANRTVATTATVKTEDTQAAEKEKQQQDSLALSQQFARLREEKIKQAESMATHPVVKPKEEKQTQVSVNEQYQQPAFSELVAEKIPVVQEVRLAAAVANRPARNNSRVLMISIGAACLLLAGVIIGLAISNSRQQENSAAIEKLVKQIQERDKKNQPVTPPVQPQSIAVQEPGSTITETENTGAVQEQLPVNEQQKESGITPVKSEEQSSSKTTKRAAVPPTQEPSPAVKIIPAVVTNKAEDKPANRQQVESAKKNIHQLVGLEANKYKTGNLGGISDLRLTVSNNSLYPLDQVEVEVRYLGPEKRVVKTQTILFNDVPAGEQKTVEAPHTNRGVTVDYVITRINSKALGLAHAGY
jgi:hypothetical protein